MKDPTSSPMTAIHRIAVYSQGRPRQINILCDNALLATYGTYQSQVSVELVEEVARDLGVSTNGRPPEKNSGTNEFFSSTPHPTSSSEHEVDRISPAVSTEQKFLLQLLYGREMMEKRSSLKASSSRKIASPVSRRKTMGKCSSFKAGGCAALHFGLCF